MQILSLFFQYIIIFQDAREALDPALDPILNMNKIKTNQTALIKFEETEIECSSKFRLYITTQTANPQLLPEMCIKVCVVNFTVTFEGLQDQLLSNVVHQERPDLENQRCSLLETLVDDKTKLREIENRTLDLLSTSVGNVLDDEDLINTLDKSKGMAKIIQDRLKDSRVTQERINGSRIEYSPVADRGAILYFVLSNLSSVDVMYQFSLSGFISLFSKCISSSKTARHDASTDSNAPKTSTVKKNRKVKLLLFN